MSDLYNEADQQPPRSGLLLLQALILGLFCLFAIRLWYLQIHQGEEFALKARENQLRQESIFSPRGLIRDRNGDLLAVNEPAYALGIVREDCPDIDKAMHQIAVWTGRDYFELKSFYNKNKKRGETVRAADPHPGPDLRAARPDRDQQAPLARPGNPVPPAPPLPLRHPAGPRAGLRGRGQ